MMRDETLEALQPAECWRRLGRSGLGRVAATVGALPTIFPVAYAVYDHAIVFRTRPGTHLDKAARDAVIAFEVDGVDAESKSVWGVVIVGPTAEVTDAYELAVVDRLPLPARTLGAQPEAVMCLEAHLVNGQGISESHHPQSHQQGEQP